MAYNRGLNLVTGDGAQTIDALKHGLADVAPLASLVKPQNVIDDVITTYVDSFTRGYKIGPPNYTGTISVTVTVTPEAEGGGVSFMNEEYGSTLDNTFTVINGLVLQSGAIYTPNIVDGQIVVVVTGGFDPTNNPEIHIHIEY